MAGGYGQPAAMALRPIGRTVRPKKGLWVTSGFLATDLHSAVVAQFSNLQGQTEEETWAWFKSRIPLARFQTPKDIGEMAAFLASDRAENITGAAFNVDGDWEMH